VRLQKQDQHLSKIGHEATPKLLQVGYVIELTVEWHTFWIRT